MLEIEPTNCSGTPLEIERILQTYDRVDPNHNEMDKKYKTLLGLIIHWD